MKNKIVNKNRFIAVLITALMFIVSFFCGVWKLASKYARAEDTYKLTAVEVNKKDEWIFTSNTPDESLYKMVTVTVTYQDTGSDPVLEDTYDLVFDGTTDTYGYVAATKESVTFALNKSNGTIMVNVTPKPGATADDGVGTASKTCGMSEGEAVQNGIVAEFLKDSAPQVTSATPMYDSSLYNGVNIYITYNDGSQDKNAVTETTYTFSGSFFPEDLYDYLTNHSGEKYNRTLTVTYNSFTTTFVWEGITFEEPDDINATRITDALDTQYARSPELNLNGLTVTFIYIDDIGETAVVVPVSVFKSYLTIKYFDNSNSDITSDIEKTGLTTKIKSINLTFKYKNWTFTGSWRNITINPLSIHVPNLPDTRDTVLTWNSTATKPNGTATINIGKWNWDYTDFPDPVIKATVANPNNSDGYDPTDEVYSSSPKEGENSLEVNIDKETGVVTVYFPKPEVYYLLTVELDPTGDFQWSNVPDHVTPIGAFILQIGVQVEKGKPEIEFSLSNADKEYVYGSGIDSGSISAMLDGEDMQEKYGVTWTYEQLGTGADPEKKHVNSNVYKYYLKYYTSYTDEENNTSVPAADLRTYDGMPKTVGTYYVVAYTYENFGYYQAVSAPVSFTITQFEIEAKASDKTFARAEWGIDNFITENNAFPYNDSTYNENVFTILTITTADGQPINSPLYNANKYNVNLSIKASDFSKNYKFKDDKSKLEFSINTYEGSKFEFKSHSWVYGNAAQAYAVESVTLLDADTSGKLSDSDLNKYFAKWSDSSATTTNRSNIAADFEIEYFYGATFGSALAGQPVAQTDLSKFEVGTYTVRLTAKAGKPLGSHTENAQTTKGQTVDYTLPVAEDTFNVNEEAIVKPTLSIAGEDDWSTSDATLKTVYRYNNGAFSSESDSVFKFENWITSTFSGNVTADGLSSIITVTISYKKPYSTSTSTKTEYVFDKDFVADEANDTVKFNGGTGVFRLQEAGTYTITVSLNKNYTWQDETDNAPYSYYGKVARQQIALLHESDITPANGVYDGSEQTKSINFGSDPLEITALTMGKLYDGHAYIDNGYRFDADGNFYVTNAGKYTVSVDIKEPSGTNKQANKDNYEWAEEVNGSVIGTLSLVYELEQATLKVKWWDGETNDSYYDGTVNKNGSYWQFTFDGENSVQKIPQAVAADGYVYGEDEILFNSESYYTLYSDEFNTTIKRADVNKIAYYYIKVSNFSGAAKPNYKLSDTNTDIGTVFQIVPFELETPQISSVPVERVYNGKTYDLAVEEFITNYADYEIGGVNRINVVAYIGVETKDAKDVGTYTVKITPKDNYTWKVNADYEFTFVITPYVLNITWNETIDPTYGITRDYSPYGVEVPTYKLDKFGNDEVFLVLGFGKGNSNPSEFGSRDTQTSANDSIKLDAGAYVLTATGLSGEQSKNYTVVGAANGTVDFTVKKAAVKTPKYTFGTVNSFKGTLTIDALDDYDGIVTVAVSGVVPGREYGKDSWLTDGAASIDIEIAQPSLSFSTNKAEFAYERAGIYTFVFKLESENHYWEGADGEDTNFTYGNGGYTYGTEPTFTVNRTKVTAPDIKNQRAQEWENTSAIEFIEKVKETNPLAGVDYRVLYATKDQETPSEDSTTWLGFDVDGRTGKQGIYYAEITLSTDQILNYVWVRNEGDVSDGTNGSDYLKGYADRFIYTSAEVKIRIYYTITLTQLKLKIAVNDYIFGDNGYVGEIGPTASFDPAAGLSVDGEHNTVYLTGESVGSLGDDITTVLVGAQFKFAKIDQGNVTVDEDRAVELVNGLPWLPGTYVLRGTLHFTKKGNAQDQDYQPLENIIATFTVSPREITAGDIQWTETAFTYNGTEQYQTASITLRIYKVDESGAKGDEVVLSGISLSIVSVDVNDGLINAGWHTVKVDEISGDEFGYFVLPVSPFTKDYEIGRRKLTVEAEAVSGHVYLDELPELLFNDDGGFVADGAKGAIALRIVKDGEVINRKAGVGTYTIEIYWIGNDCIHAKNYDYTFVTADFVIVKRVIEVAWEDGATCVYGSNDINLHSHLGLTVKNGVEDSLVSETAHSVISLEAYTEIEYLYNLTLGYRTPAGTYYILPASTDEANWEITFLGYTDAPADWAYVITNATIIPDDDSFKTVEKTETAQGLVYDATEQSIFVGTPSVTTVNNLNATWSYSEVKQNQTESDVAAGAWKDLEATAPVIKIRDAGWHYFVIKIEADSHDTLYKYVKVYMEKATLNVQFNFTIMYGEDNPVSRKYQFDDANGQGFYTNVRNAKSHWTIKGFKEDDEAKFRNAAASADFYNLIGIATYEVNGYDPLDCLFSEIKDYYSLYEITFRSFTLECDNYEFAFPAESSYLTVNRITLTVTAKKDLSTVYNNEELKQDNKYLKVEPDVMDGYAYTVENPASSYGGGKYNPTYTDYTKLFFITSQAFDKNENSTTNDVGNSYKLQIEIKDSYYFDITGVDADFEVTPATLSEVKDVEGYTADYDEQYHGLIVVYGEGDKRSTVKDTGKPVEEDLIFATASDETKVEIWYYGTTDTVGKVDESYWKGLSGTSKTAPAYIDRGTYYIVYRLTAGDNYIDVYGVVKIEIYKGTNVLGEGFDFANGTAKQHPDTDGLKDAWIYGYNGDGKAAGGYNPGDTSKNGHAITSVPKTQFKRANSSQVNTPLYYELRYSASSIQGAINASALGGYTDYDDVKKLFEDVLNDGLFNAGYYCLRVYMKLDGSENFKFDAVDFIFRVAKRDLTIKAKAASTVYGEAAPAFEAEYKGLVSNTPDADADSIDKALGTNGYNPNFRTSYNVGDDVGSGYYIRANIKVDEAANYEIKYEDAYLTVTARTVIITINDKVSTYNDKDNLQTLTFTVVAENKQNGNYDIYVNERDSQHVAGDKYDNTNQSLLTLYTEALVGYSSATGLYGTTNDVKFEGDEIVGYTIFAVLRGEAKSNYVIRFYNCSTKEERKTVPFTIDGKEKNLNVLFENGVNNAGNYVIEQAEANLIFNGLYHYDGDDSKGAKIKTDIYSGYINYYEVLLEGAKDKDGNDIAIPFTYYKAGTGTIVPKVVNAGKYEARGSSTNLNYTASGTMIFPIEIKQATIYLKANDTTVEYGTKIYGDIDADLANGAVKEDGSGRFKGFTYTAESGYIDDEKSIPQLPETIVNHYAMGGGATVKYSYDGYSPTSYADSSFNIVPVCTDTYGGNVKVDTGKNTGKLTVLKRKVEVTIVGWDEANKNDKSKHNPKATCLYQGTHDRLAAEFEKQYTNNRSLFIYTDEKDTFGSAFEGRAIDYSVLGISLSLPGSGNVIAVNVGEYDMSWTVVTESTTTFIVNYDVTVTNSTSAKPQFCVQKNKISLYAYANSSTYESIEYGNIINRVVTGSVSYVGKLNYSVKGVFNEDNFINDCLGSTYNVVFTLRAGINDISGKEYEPWVSGVGNYTVYVGIAKVTDGKIEFVDDPFTNYVIDKYVTASIKIIPRVISASTTSQKFEFDGKNYNGGLYGKSHEAVIKFTNAWTKTGDEGVDYSPVFTLSYDTKRLANGNNVYQTATKAPTVVGDYEVTVHLDKSGNYSFGDEVFEKSLEFSVTPINISVADLRWDNVSITVNGSTAATVSNFIDKYQNGYMRVAGFEFAPTGSSAVDLLEGDALTPGTYYFDSDGRLNITMAATSIGRYNVRIELLSDAKNNIKLMSGTAEVDFVNVAFIVTSSTVKMEVEFSGFEYGKEPGIPAVYINDKQVTNNLLMGYARIDVDDENLSAVKKLCQDSLSNKGLTASELGSTSFGNLTMSPNFVAGYYVLYVQYSYSGEGGNIMQERYCVFEVTKKIIVRPEVETTQLTYNGKGQSIEVSYNATLMTPVFNGGTMVITGEGAKSVVTFTVTDADSYVIQFVLVDGTNTKWQSDDETDIGSTLSFDLEVARDTALEVDATDPAIVLKERTEDYGIPYSLDFVEIANGGYSGLITLYYMVNDGGAKPDINDARWLNYERRAHRLGVGVYWIKAEVTDTTKKNFISKSVIGLFTVNPKQITATVSGEITYGDLLENTHFIPYVEGLMSGDGWTGDAWTVDGYSYKFIKDYTIRAGGTFYIILETNEDGSVKGIDAGSNYRVVAEAGLLVVNKCNITIEITGKSSDYSVTPDTENVEFKITDGKLGYGEDVSVLALRFETTATANSPAGGEYWITIASYDDTNYVITYQRALYVINPLEIEIELEVQSDIVYNPDPTANWCAKLDGNKVKISNSQADVSIVRDNITLTLKFTGMTFAGVPYDSEEAPTQAGTYVAQVLSAGNNFILTGLPSVEFTIQKKELDDGKMSIANQTYTGLSLTPVIAIEDNLFGSDLYNALLLNYIDAGTYDINITLKDSNNYQWKSTPGDTTVVKFTVDKADDEETERLTITGWQYSNYSAAVNRPSAAVKSGNAIYYEYSIDGGVTYTNVIPENGNVGVYYVRVTVLESANYNAYVGEAVAFEITKYILGIPQLTSSDNTYTGEELIANISNVDVRYMSVLDNSDARTFIGATGIIAVTVNAGVYKIYIGLSDTANFAWADNAGDNQGVFTLTWTIGKMKVELPKAGKNRFIVNGNDIVYIPDGFDENIMTIERNVYSYGGNFTAIIRLKDTSNYEWVNGEDAIALEWHITGAEVLFYIILSALLLFTMAGIAGIVTQVTLDRREAKTAAAAMNEIESKDVLEGEDSSDGGTAETGGGEDAQTQNSESDDTAEGGEM